MPAGLRQKAFTIVELMIVIVVIAILAAITLVVFNGATERARQSLLKDALAKVSRQLELDKVNRGVYAPQLADAGGDAINNVDYQYTSNGIGYCVTATTGPTSMHVCSGGQIASGPYLGSAEPGAPSGHSDPNAPPPIIDIVASSLAQADVPGQTTPVSHTTAIPGTLDASDTVLVLYNLDFYSHVQSVNAGSTQFTKMYRQTMGAAGYQQTVAYMATGMTGSQTLQTLGCYGGNSTSACYTGANFKAHYMVFVIKGKSAQLTLSSTETSYGSQSTGTTISPANGSVAAGDIVFFAYVYYGNNMPTINDTSSPNLSWTAASTRSNALSRPGSNNGTALGVWYATAQGAGTASRNMTMPASGAAYAGATMFVLK